MTVPAFAAKRRAAAPWLMSEGACYRSVSPARGALSSKPAARRYCFVDRRETDGRTLNRFTDPALHTMWAASIRRVHRSGIIRLLLINVNVSRTV